MKRIVLTIALVALVVLALGAVAVGALDGPSLQNVDPTGGGGIAQNVE